jgi:DNA polymerase III delta prime subunit
MNWTEKYRPDDFIDMVGVDETVEQIEGFILSENIPHLLFHGEPGTGKTTLGRIIADKITGDYPENIIEVNASDERGIENIRKIALNAIRHVPLGGTMRVIILDESDGLTREAQQIMRRPMEKSGNTLFIIICNDVKCIIKPIISRCAVFQFDTVKGKDIIHRLKTIADNEGVTVNSETLTKIATKAGGDMRSAINEMQKLTSVQKREDHVQQLAEKYLKQMTTGQSEG